jgi:hypothetical protein
VEEMLSSFQAVVETRHYDSRRFNLRTAAWGMLSRFDLPDLAVCIAPRPLRIVCPLDAAGQAVVGG